MIFSFSHSESNDLSSDGHRHNSITTANQPYFHKTDRSRRSGPVSRLGHRLDPSSSQPRSQRGHQKGHQIEREREYIEQTERILHRPSRLQLPSTVLFCCSLCLCSPRVGRFATGPCVVVAVLLLLLLLLQLLQLLHKETEETVRTFHQKQGETKKEK